MTGTGYLNAIYSVFTYGARRAGLKLTSPPLPPAVSIELSSICNLSCPECITGSGQLRRKRPFIDVALAESVASQLAGKTVSAWLYFQGEPMMHPAFFTIAAMFRDMKTVISTNGHFLDPVSCRRLAHSGLSKVIIPLDGAGQDVYGIYRRGGDYETVTEGIKSLARAIRESGSATAVEIQMLAGRHNTGDADAIRAFARSVNASFRIKSMQVLDQNRAAQWIPEKRGRARYVMTGEGYAPARAPRSGCFRMWKSAVITADGDVLPCCFDKLGKHAMGNLRDASFREIWHSEKYRRFRQAVMAGRKNVDICSSCPEGTRLFFRK